MKSETDEKAKPDHDLPNGAKPDNDLPTGGRGRRPKVDNDLPATAAPKTGEGKPAQTEERKAELVKQHDERKRRIHDVVSNHKTVAGGAEAAFNIMTSAVLEAGSFDDVKTVVELLRRDQRELIESIVANTGAK